MDEADTTQARQEVEEEFMRKQRAAQASKLAAAPVVTVCECGEELSAFRITNRYVLCVECQTAKEKNGKHYRRET